jgi:hypothetical protein
MPKSRKYQPAAIAQCLRGWEVHTETGCVSFERYADCLTVCNALMSLAIPFRTSAWDFWTARTLTFSEVTDPIFKEKSR